MEKGYIVINLLPYREKIKKDKIRQLGLLMGLFGIASIAVVFLIYSGMNILIDNQKSRNTFIADENTRLSGEIKQIVNLKSEIRDTLAKRQVVEGLQVNRSDGVNIFNFISSELPDSTTLKTISQKDEKLTIVGDTTSNNKVSNYMTNLAATNFFINPELVEVKGIQIPSAKINGRVADDQNLNEFTLNIYLKPKIEPTDDTTSKKKKFNN